MKLIIGGASQGKRETACRLFEYRVADMTDGRECPLQDIKTCGAIHHFHEYILRYIRSGQNVDQLAEILENENPDILIITDEIGYGIVPIDREQRLWREQTGRVCCQLAAFSDVVIRVVAGVPMFIKGNTD